MINDQLEKRHHHLPHWQQGGSVYFITFNTRSGILKPEERQIICDCLRFGNEKEYRLYTGVVMPDHVHILIQPLNKRANEWFDLATILKKIKGISARKINRIRKTNGSIWRSESYDRIIRDDDEMKEKWNYIITNPVRAGLVSDIDDYPFVIKGYD